jgi:hypothetical protein
MASVKKCLVVLAISVAGISGTASAQYTLNGSDTLEFVMKQTILKASNTPGSGLTPGQLNYLGGGSGAGENNLTANKQSIAAMSRNLKSSVTSATPTVGKADPNSWLNIVGLDAAVFAQYGGVIKNINLPIYADTVDTTNKAVPNKWGTCSVTTSQRCAFKTDPSAANAGCPAGESCVADATSQTYTNLIEVILSGVDGSGSTLACSHPARLKAIADLGLRQGAVLAHWFRRDDNSGTTDTFKDKIGVKNFCNGRARGILSTQRYCVATTGVYTNTTCAAQADCDAKYAAGTTTCTGFVAPTVGNPGTFNVSNQDLDPIRVPCKSDGQYLGVDRAVTNCTNIYAGRRCTASENPDTCDPTVPYDPVTGPTGCPCTQGFVVALSVGDTYGANDAGTGPYSDLLDVTKTISSRVSSGQGPLMGYAGRESVRQASFNTNGPSISTYSFSDGTIRNDDYLMSRRLFVARASANTDATQNTGEAAPGGSLKYAVEAALFSYMTDDGTNSFDLQPGACHIRDIVTQYGFLGCTSNCNDIPTGSNLCAKSMPWAPSFPNPGVPGWDVNGGPWWDYGPSTWVQTGTNVNTGTICLATNPVGANGGSGNPAQVVPDATTKACPTGWATRPNGYACSHNRECASGLCADDGQAIGILTCQ